MDVQTILIVMICMNLASAGAVSYSRGLSNVMGERNWALSLLMDAAAILLLTTQGSWPPIFSVLLANICIVAGFSLKYISLSQCFKSRVDPLVVTVPIGAVLLLFPFFLGDLAARILIVSAAILVLMGAILRVLLIPASGGRLSSRRLLIFSAVVIILLAGVRFIYGLSGTGNASAVTLLSDLYAITTLGYLVTAVLATFGVLSVYNERLTEDIERRATIDPLTNIFNRRAFIGAAERELARGDRSGRYPCLLMLDIDHFKKINDTWGHAAGDQVLIKMTEALQAALREQDVLARFGGEEFSILLPETDRQGAIILAERLRDSVASVIARVGQKTVRITSSIGIAVARDGDTLDDVVGRADQAMYAAKEAGRNCVKIEPPPQLATAH